MSDAIFLPFDCESGGIGDEVSILTAHFAACDEDWNVLDELDLKVKPVDGIYKVKAEAMSINKIDLIAHDKEAMTYSEAGQRLREFLIRNSQNGKIKLQPMGKNIGGDIDWVTQHLLGRKTFNQYVSYRVYDITTMVTLLKRQGKLAWDAPESLQELCKYFDIQADWHTASGDNFAGIQLVKKLEDL